MVKPANLGLTKEKTRYFRRCLSSPAGFPLGPPDANHARRALEQAKGLNA
jgi:hypothetical protein